MTPPDTDFASTNQIILVINAPEHAVQALALALKLMPVPVDVYLYRDEFEDSGWAFSVAAVASKVFTFPDTNVKEIVEFLQENNG